MRENQPNAVPISRRTLLRAVRNSVLVGGGLLVAKSAYATRADLDVYVQDAQGGYLSGCSIQVKKNGSTVYQGSTPTPNNGPVVVPVYVPGTFEVTVTCGGTPQIQTHYLEEDGEAFFEF